MTKEERAIYRGKRCAKYITLDLISHYLGYSHTYISLFEKNERNLTVEKENSYKNYIDEY